MRKSKGRKERDNVRYVTLNDPNLMLSTAPTVMLDPLCLKAIRKRGVK